MSNVWKTGRWPTGPYVPGTVEGRMREMEEQIDELTSLVERLTEVVKVTNAGDVKIVGKRSVTLEATPAKLVVSASQILTNHGISTWGKGNAL